MRRRQLLSDLSSLTAIIKRETFVNSKLSLDEPLLAQLERQDIREMLNLPLEQPTSKISIEELLRVAQAAIRAELVECNCDENELIGLRLEYTLPKKEAEKPEEIYSVEWNQLPQDAISAREGQAIAMLASEAAENGEENLSTVEETSSSELSVSTDFLNRLVLRVDEAVMTLVPDNTSSAISWKFRASSFLQYGGGCCRRQDGRRYRKVKKDGRWECGDQECRIPDPEQPPLL